MRLKLAGFVFAAAGLIAAQSANAADMANKATMPLKAVKAYPTWNWTGFYLGGYAGVGVNRSHGVDPTGANNGETNSLGAGFTGGGTIGYNLQFAPNWVAGIEGDLGYFGLSHDRQQYNETDFRTNEKTSWLGTARARLGYTSGPSLSYITGGAAWVHTEDTIGNLAGTVTATESKTRSGYAFGSGVETRLGGGWTAKSEFLVVDVGSGSTLAANGFVLQNDTHRYSVQRFGLNYQFDKESIGPLPQFNWTGFYAGVVGGGAVSQTKLTGTDGTVGEFGSNGSGSTLGAVAGYNWQVMPNWVVGVEGDFSWLGINHSVDDYNDSLALYSQNTKWMATARGRIGYSTGPALLYVTGGAAWVNYNESWDFGSGPVSSHKTLAGYTVGGGIETVMSILGPGWTSKSEYLYINVGKGDVLTDPNPSPIVADHAFHVFRSGLVYHFGR